VIRVARSTVIAAPLARVWALLRDFNAHAEWHPAVAESAIEADEPADLVGAVRAFRLADGGFLREQLIALSDQEPSLTYCLLEAPLPLHFYVATMRLRPVTADDRTLLQWESRFAPPPVQAAALERLVAETIYEAGMTALRARFEA
jgi:uncharacterized protein YndB with AHSA1/START domain